MKGILAGFCISIGAIIYLTIGGYMGAALFSIGLIAILAFGYELFTGKAGLLITREISVANLLLVYIYNLIGATFCAIFIKYFLQDEELINAATKVLENRNAQSFLINLTKGAFCGSCMYIAVSGFKKTGNYLLAVVPVMVFILAGFNHSVADMFYIGLAASHISDYWSLIPTTIGNIIGANFFGFNQLLEYNHER